MSDNVQTGFNVTQTKQAEPRLLTSYKKIHQLNSELNFMEGQHCD